jgi:hypothetical protein
MIYKTQKAKDWATQTPLKTEGELKIRVKKTTKKLQLKFRIRVMVFNTTFNNISVISCRSVL